jgi:hypothetical protein
MADDLLLQAPGETLDYSFDWTEWLAGDTLNADPSMTDTVSAWSISPAGPTIEFSAIISPEGDDTGTQTVAFVSGLSFGQVYQLTNEVTTVGLRVGQRSLTIRGWNR